MRFGEPIAFTVIFPFIARFLEDLHVTDDPSKLGYWAGIIVRKLRVHFAMFETDDLTHFTFSGIALCFHDVRNCSRLGTTFRSDRQVCSIPRSCPFADVFSRLGRKPVLLIGLTGVTISIIAFGLSKSFTALIVSRCIGGALNGNVAVIKGTLGELTDETNQARAFSVLPLAWSLGSAIG